jgi:hypothetical protein
MGLLFLSRLLSGKEIQLHVGHREQLHAAFGIVRDLQYKLL